MKTPSGLVHCLDIFGCPCHKPTPTEAPTGEPEKGWREEFDDIVRSTKYSEYRSGGRFCCGGDYCEEGHNEWLKSFIRKVEQSAEERGRAKALQHAIELSDRIELEGPDGGMEQWKAFKHFRNTLRDSLTPTTEANDKKEI